MSRVTARGSASFTAVGPVNLRGTQEGRVSNLARMRALIYLKSMSLMTDYSLFLRLNTKDQKKQGLVQLSSRAFKSLYLESNNCHRDETVDDPCIDCPRCPAVDCPPHAHHLRPALIRA